MKRMSSRPQAVLSRKLAVEGLFKLAETKPYNEITISDICLQAGIARQTFYRNFKTKEDVIKYYLEDLVGMHMKNITGIMEQDVGMFFKTFPFPDKIISLLYKNRLLYLFTDSVIPLIQYSMENDHWPYLLLGDHKYDDYYSRFLANTMVSILETWTAGGFRESKEELNLIMQNLLKGFRQ